MAIECVQEPSHSFHKVSVPGHPELDRIVTDLSAKPMILPAAVHWARCMYAGDSLDLQTPQDAWIVRLAQDKSISEPLSFDYQATRGITIVWFENDKPLITIYSGVQDNLALMRTQEGYDSYKTAPHDWQVPLSDLRRILERQKDKIRPHPGTHVSLNTPCNEPRPASSYPRPPYMKQTYPAAAEQDPNLPDYFNRSPTKGERRNAVDDLLTQDLFGQATPLIVQCLADQHYETLEEYFPQTKDIKPGYARIRGVGIGAFGFIDVDASVHFGGGYARGVVHND